MVAENELDEGTIKFTINCFLFIYFIIARFFFIVEMYCICKVFNLTYIEQVLLGRIRCYNAMIFQ